MTDMSGDGRPGFSHAEPMERGFNHLIAGAHFDRKFGRWPLPPDDAAATINDLIFARMIDPDWSALQRAFVDKSSAKAMALRSCPSLRVPETLAIIPVSAAPSPAQLHDLLWPFIGTDAIAKPTHASGSPVFLRDVTSPADLAAMHRLATIDYAEVMREMQYHHLPRQIIVEALVPTRGMAPPDDVKFHCIHGEPLLCQIDHARFGTAWSRLFRVPGFEPMDADDGLTTPAGYRQPAPDRIAAMIAAARVLAAPFDFVRVDFYDGADGIYFGELTFTPAASLGIAPSAAGCHRETPTHREYSRTLMQAFRRGGRRAG